MGTVFISYRRSDSGYVAQAIRDRLIADFGEGSVFMDIDNIPLGVDFRKYIVDAVTQCDALIALIGDDWAGTAGDTRRIDNADDFVRIELETALGRGIPVIPVLVDNATVPSAAQLPPTLSALAYRNATEVRSGKVLTAHLDMLVRGVAPYLMEKPASDTDSRKEIQPPAASRIGATGADVSAHPPDDGTGPRRMKGMVVGGLAAISLVVVVWFAIDGRGGLSSGGGSPPGNPADPKRPGAASSAAVSAKDSARLAFEAERASARSALQPLLRQVGDEGLTAGGVFDSSKKWDSSKKSLGVCFLDGSQSLRSRVATVARQWTLYTSIGFDFGDWDDPRMCTNDQKELDVRVTFKKQGNWSYVGTDAAKDHDASEPTMSLETVNDEDCKSDPKPCDHAILHEFGHTIGFVHGWMSPLGDCSNEMNWPVVYGDAAASYGWTRAQVDQNLRPQASESQTAGAFDRRSVMNYELPAKWFKKGKDSKCFLTPLSELSLRDKLAAYKYYQ